MLLKIRGIKELLKSFGQHAAICDPSAKAE